MRKSIFIMLVMVSVFLVGCSQPTVFNSIEESKEKLLEEVDFDESLEEISLYDLDEKEYKLLKEATSKNKLEEDKMVDIARGLLEEEVKIYTLSNDKEDFENWLERVFINPKEYQFLKHYNELGNYKEVSISFDLEENVERVEKLGQTGFIYRNVMELTGVNKETENKEMAILNFIVHIDMNKDGEYRIVKMGGATASDIIDFN